MVEECKNDKHHKMKGKKKQNKTVLEWKQWQQERDRQKLWRLRKQIIEAVKYRDHSKLKPLLRDLEKVRMTKALLLLTCIGYLVHDYQLWGKSNLLNIPKVGPAMAPHLPCTEHPEDALPPQVPKYVRPSEE